MRLIDPDKVRERAVYPRKGRWSWHVDHDVIEAHDDDTDWGWRIAAPPVRKRVFLSTRDVLAHALQAVSKTQVLIENWRSHAMFPTYQRDRSALD
jgi:hypothetical protein